MATRIQQIIEDENLQQLEFPLLLNKLRELLTTPYSHGIVDGMEVLHKKEAIEKRLLEVTEMKGLMEGGHTIPIHEHKDILPLLERLQPENAFLESSELNEIKNNLQEFDGLAAFIKENRESCPNLFDYAGRIHSHKSIISEIEGAIDPRGEIRENASPELRRIRIEMQQQEGEQKKILLRALKHYSEFSQDEIITLRDGRMVLGIQYQYASRVSGIVHGTSGSGATVFIEPMETLRLSNRIQNLRIEERKEIIRILKFLSGLIREIRHDIHYAIENFATLDFIHAKARLSAAMNAAAPQISETPAIGLLQARHPLLLLKMGHQNVVPLSMSLGEDVFTFLITGPNAGGKTVALKTIGLMVVMAQSGLHIPAQPDSIIPVLDGILVDIGDRQNLEQDLSTFSAHIIRLQKILRQANTHTLALIDEIGTGTDPREGAALAIAILQELTERSALTVATTHHGELKAFAFSTEKVENASMEFDVETLQPTYRLQAGVPGSSYAFEIARRYHLSESVLERASRLMGADKGQLEDLILNLNNQLQQAEKDRRELSIKLSETEGLRNLYQNEVDRLKREKIDLRRQAAEEARQIVDEANAQIEKLIAEIRETQAEKEKIRQAHSVISQLKEETEREISETTPVFEQTADLHKGDVVWLDDIRREGELLSEPDHQNNAWILFDSKKLKMDVSRLKKVAKKAADSGKAFKKEHLQEDRLEGGVLPELDLRGLDSYEAVQRTNLYLDQAVQQGWEEVRIIHGKGSGVLRKAVNDFLARDNRVEEKRLGKWGEGGTGITMVKLKK
jgi:DNA mismatch repair protein MutS2